MSDIVERLNADHAIATSEMPPHESLEGCASDDPAVKQWLERFNVWMKQRLEAEGRLVACVPEATAEITRLRDEVERLEANLALRDSFIVAQGMWSEFVEQLPFKHSIAVTREGKTKVARAALDG